MDKEKHYYDMDFEIEAILQGSGVTDMLYLKDICRRKFFLNEEICQETVSDICRHIMQINREDADIPTAKRKPILLYISSNGGSVDPGFQLINCIESSVTPVYTINIGYAYSMAFLIALSGHKRFAMRHSKYMWHDGTNFVYGTGTKVQDQMEFQKRSDDRIRTYVLEHSSITPEEYDAKIRVEWYMFADEAKQNGFVDAIVEEDCPLGAVI